MPEDNQINPSFPIENEQQVASLENEGTEYSSYSTLEGRRNKISRKKLLFIGLLLIVLGIVSIGTTIKATNSPGFCKSCHEMNPEYYTWQGSDHSQIACVSCHVKPGIFNTVMHKVKSLSLVYYHFTGSYTTPISLNEEIDNVQCEQCHDMSTRVLRPSGDLKFDHNKHLDQNIKCIECHSGVAHGSIEENGVTAMGDFDKWDVQIGKAYVSSPNSRNFTNMAMDKCLDCHKAQNVSVSCNTCHVKLNLPESHATPVWLTTHGKEAAKGFNACNTCHSKTVTTTLYKNATLVDYARANSFCNSCHAKEKPPGHTVTWNKDHQFAAKDNRELCLVCHNQTGTKATNGAATTVSCQKCHGTKHQIPKFHPVNIPPSGYQASCNRCHSARTCEKCHAKS